MKLLSVVTQPSIYQLSYVRFDDNVNETRNEFKRSVVFTCPVKNNKKRGNVHISYVSIPRTAGKGKGRENEKWVKKSSFKPSNRNTGVELRYYKSDGFSALTQEQRDELQAHCNSDGNYK